MTVPIVLHSLQHLVLSGLWQFLNLSLSKRVPASHLIFLVTNDVEHLFKIPLFSFLIKCLFQSFAHLKIGLFFLLLSCKSFVCVQDTSPLSDSACKSFFPVWAYLFIILTVSFKEWKFLYFDEVQFINFFSIMAYAFSVLFKKSFSNLRSQSVSPIFFNRSLIVWGLTFRSIIHFKFNFHI